MKQKRPSQIYFETASFFVKYHIDVCRFKNMNKILGSVKKKCIFVIYRRAFLKVGKNDVESNILLL